MPSNQGRDIESLLNIVDGEDLDDIAESAIWPSVRSHGKTATCFCPAVEALARLRELGYAITKGETNG